MKETIFSAISSYGSIAVGVIVLGYIYVKHIKGALNERLLKKIDIAFAVFLVGMTAFSIMLYYSTLRFSSGGRVFLPPHQSWDWFLRATFSGFVFPVAISLIAAIAMYYAAIATNKVFGGELFANEDKYIFVFAALVVGWPNFVVYLGISVVLTVFLSGIATLRHGADTRVVLTDALLFAIPITLLFASTLSPYLHLFKLGIYA